MKGIWAVPIIASILILGVIGLQEAWAPTKIAPTKGEPGHPFTIIDTPDGRLLDGSVAVFKLNGAETTTDLKTHKPHKTAQGNVPDGLGGGDYEVSFRSPSGTEIDVGTFKVIAEPTGGNEPTIEPISGLPEISFTITDPQGRIQDGDLAIFYPLGSDPDLQGVNAENISISSDGTTLTGNVPSIPEGEHLVSVRPPGGESRFADLPFFRTSGTGF